MEIRLDSFAAKEAENAKSGVTASVRAMDQLLERIELADQVGLDSFGIGEHYRQEFLDSAPAVILAAAASRTKQIRLNSAVTVLSAADPVRTFQQYATLDILSHGRAEIVVGRGSFTEAYPLFGLDQRYYDELFIEKLKLLLQIRDNEFVTWQGRFRPALNNQPIYPRPVQEQIPIWIGVGGTPGSFERAGLMGLPLMVAVIGGETKRFRPLIDLYRDAWRKAGHPEEGMKVGLHSLGYVEESSARAVQTYYPGYEIAFNKIGKERGWPPVTRDRFNLQNGYYGAYLVGSPEEVADKIVRHSESLGGIDRFTFQIDHAGLTHKQQQRSIELIGLKVKPLVNEALSAK